MWKLVRKQFPFPDTILDPKLGPYQVGRIKKSEIRCLSNLVSREHCVLEFDDDGWFIKDLKSFNGTFVNGDKLESDQWYHINHGDKIGLAEPDFPKLRNGHKLTDYFIFTLINSSLPPLDDINKTKVTEILNIFSSSSDDVAPTPSTSSSQVEDKQPLSSNPVQSTSKDVVPDFHREIDGKAGGSSSFPKHTGFEKKGTSEMTIMSLPIKMLIEILKCMTTRELLHCRLVNKSWMKTSNELLKHRPEMKLTFSNNFSLLWNGNKSTRSSNDSLESFIKCIKNSKQDTTPFGRIEIHHLDNRTKDLELFFKEFGSSIVSMEVQRPMNQGEIRALRDLLFTDALNIEELIINGEDCEFREDDEETGLELFSLFPDKSSKSTFKLPQLKFIVLKGDKFHSFRLNFIKELISAASNLKSIIIKFEGDRDRLYIQKEDIQFFNSIGKCHLLNHEVSICLNNEQLENYWKRYKGKLLKVKKLILYTGIRGEVEQPEFLRKATQYFENQFKQFNTAEIEEKEKKEMEIDDDDEFSRISKFLNRILIHTGETLREIDIPPLGSLNEINLNLFKNVQRLKISVWKNPFQLIFPLGAHSNTTIFPHLVDLTIQGSKFNNVASFSCIDSIPVIPTVRSLSVQLDYKNSPLTLTTDFIQKMALMCPNLCSLTVDSAENFPEFGPSIWKHMKNLTSLNLSLLVDDSNTEHYKFCLKKSVNMFPYVDATFTGFSEETVEFVLDKYKTGQQLSLLGNIVRENASILDLSHLKRLTVQLVMHQESNSSASKMKKTMTFEQKRIFNQIMSPLAHLYAFDKIPDLEFTLKKVLIGRCDCQDYPLL